MQGSTDPPSRERSPGQRADASLGTRSPRDGPGCRERGQARAQVEELCGEKGSHTPSSAATSFSRGLCPVSGGQERAPGDRQSVSSSSRQQPAGSCRSRRENAEGWAGPTFLPCLVPARAGICSRLGDAAAGHQETEQQRSWGGCAAAACHLAAWGRQRQLGGTGAAARSHAGQHGQGLNSRHHHVA